MNKDTVGGEWKQMKGAVKKQWGKLTDDDLASAEGNKDQILGKIQERYGLAKDEAQRQWLNFEKKNRDENDREKKRDEENSYR